MADGDGIEGEILDIRMFHTLLKHPEGNVITYPNSLLLQKSVTKILPKAATKPASVSKPMNKNRKAN